MTKDVEVEVRRNGDAGVLLAPGYINQTSGEQIARACDELIDGGVTRLVFNLEDCNSRTCFR